MSPAGFKHIPLLDLKAQHARIREEVMASVVAVIDSQQFILGEEVQKLEQEIAAYCRARFAVGCASGSDALYLALLAIGVQAGDKVLTTPYTFFATAGAVVRAGAIPVFVDIEPDTCNMDINQAAATLRNRADIRAVIPVHLFGACVDMDPLLTAAGERGVPVIEDAAQSIGSEYKGRRAGSMGEVGCFSFFPSKNLGGYGDGGMVTTSDPALAERLPALRVHGARQKYVHEWVGINSRLDALQAAVLRVKLRHLDSWSEARGRNAEVYRRLLAQLGLPVTPLSYPQYVTRNIYNQFVIRSRRRDELRDYLQQNGVGTEIYYPLPLHLQKCFTDLAYKEGSFPVSERVASESLALPIHPELSLSDIERVCGVIGDFYGVG